MTVFSRRSCRGVSLFGHDTLSDQAPIDFHPLVMQVSNADFFLGGGVVMDLASRLTELAKKFQQHRKVLLTEQAAKTALSVAPSCTADGATPSTQS